MTSQSRKYVEPSDLTALRCDCNHCHASISLPFAVEGKAESLFNCPNCKRSWSVFIQGDKPQSIHNTIATFMSSVNKLVEDLRRTDGFTVTLEVLDETKPSS